MRRPFGETTATCTLGQGERFRVIEHVPARVRGETGEPFFASQTAEHLHAIIRGNRKPDRMIQTSVYEFTCSRVSGA